MSYDLMVFETTKSPTTKEEFLKWYSAQTEWREDHDYQTKSVASFALQQWYEEMKRIFPPMNGLDAPTDEQIAENDELEEYLSDYSIGRDVIYVAFAWSKADAANKLTKQLAQKHGVGFFDVSADAGDIILPDGSKIV